MTPSVRKRLILRLLAALVFSLLLTVGGSCTAPSLFVPIPPPNPTFGPPTSAIDSDGIAHTYWKVTSPPSEKFADVWVYLTNIDRGLGASVQAGHDGAYATQIEGQQGDRIIFGLGAPDNEIMCSPLREGLAAGSCQ